MKRVKRGALVTILADTRHVTLGPGSRALAAANGSGTLPHGIRVSRPGLDASVSTLLSSNRQPPAWLEKLVQDDIPRTDDLGVITLETLVRFARVCSALPAHTPKPYYGVGDDATIGVEWDLGRFHIEIQVGNNPAVDAILFEVAEGEPNELPLEGNIGALAVIMARIVND